MCSQICKAYYMSALSCYHNDCGNIMTDFKKNQKFGNKKRRHYIIAAPNNYAL